LREDFMTITAEAICFRGGRRMSWQRVAALGLLVGGAIAAAAFHNNDVIAATLAGAAAGSRSIATPIGTEPAERHQLRR
jgi:hypothetical protein